MFLLQVQHILLMAPTVPRNFMFDPNVLCFTLNRIKLAYRAHFFPSNMTEGHCERKEFKIEQNCFEADFLFLTNLSCKSLFATSS